MLKVLFVLRVDAKKKAGGDLIQANYYKKVLEENFECQITFAHENSLKTLRATEWDVVHLFNISRINENMAILARLRYKKLLFSPIIQPGFSFNIQNYLKNIARCIIFKKLSIKGVLASPSEFFKSIDALVFLSPSEMKFFEECYSGFNCQKIIFPNGVSVDRNFIQSERCFEFIVVGRIEPKKRVVEAIDTVLEVSPSSKIICIGGLNFYHPLYCLKFFFRTLSGRAIYLGSRSPEVVHAFMRNSRTLLNFSELEVSPLVDLEALANGCSVVSTKYSFTHLDCNESFVRVDVKDYVECAKAVKKSLSFCPTKNIKINNWDENSGEYIEYIKNCSFS